MNQPGPQNQKGHNDTDTTTNCLELPQKRSTQVEEDEGTPPPQRRRVSSLDDQRREEHRASNRLEPHRSRLCHQMVITEQQMTIRNLQSGKMSLQVTNKMLCRKLDEALYLNRQLRRIMEEDIQVLITKNARLHSLLELSTELPPQVQPPHRFPSKNPPSAGLLSGVASTPSYESLPHRSNSVFGRGQERSSDRIQGKSTNDKGTQESNDSSMNPFYNSPLLLRSSAHESGRPVESPSANTPGGGPSDVLEILCLQQELKELKEEVKKKLQS